MPRLLLLIFCLLSLPSFAQSPPKNIDEAISYFETHWTTAEKNTFKKMPEEDAVAEYHMSTGMWIRNNWIHGHRDTSLVNQFLALGIDAPDDMSSIILRSLHRKLNNLPLDIDGQVEKYKAYWKPIIECNEKTRKTSVENYNKYNIGDSIKILMYVDTSQGQRNAVLVNCPDIDWEFSPQKDLLLQCVVTQKYFLGDSSNVFFQVQILKMNFENTKILMNVVKPNDHYDFHLDLVRIE
jgi:hypothetical protein